MHTVCYQQAGERNAALHHPCRERRVPPQRFVVATVSCHGLGRAASIPWRYPTVGNRALWRGTNAAGAAARAPPLGNSPPLYQGHGWEPRVGSAALQEHREEAALPRASWEQRETRIKGAEAFAPGVLPHTPRAGAGLRAPRVETSRGSGTANLGNREHRAPLWCEQRGRSVGKTLSAGPEADGKELCGVRGTAVLSAGFVFWASQGLATCV